MRMELFCRAGNVIAVHFEPLAPRATGFTTRLGRSLRRTLSDVLGAPYVTPLNLGERTA